ncbi:MAG: hypothetical protein NTX79_03665 [Candidatus Micrarchaeota archaeon]|nr:hypothetical protein [Candidatus Micrarchaeota archaeon]
MRAHTLFLSILFLSLPALAFSENATSESTPPSVPQAEGLVALRAMLVDGTSPVGMPLAITAAKADGATTTYRLITGRGGNVLLTLGSGSYQLNCVLDNMATSGADYAATASLSLPGEQNLSLVFYPAGSVAVTVLEGGQIVPGAAIQASCASDWFDYGKMAGASVQAGQAGDFMFRALPTGTCVISASTQASAGSVRVEVEQGKLSSAQLEMKPKASGLSGILLVLAAIAVAAVIAYYVFFSSKKRAPREHETGEKEAPPADEAGQRKKARAGAPQEFPSGLGVKSERARAVLSTLSEREAEIVRFLFSSGGKAKRSTMQHRLLIPKTSLLRNLRSLERKRIVKLIPFGRNMVAELQRNLFE